MSQNRRLIKDATRNFYLEGKQTEEYSWFDFVHGYTYIKWPYLYIGVGLGEHRLSWFLAPLFLFLTSLFSSDKDQDHDPGYEWANSYHGKVVQLEEAKRLVSIQEDVVIKDLEKVIPYSKAKDIILKNPDRIAVLDCPCRVSRKDPCTPLDVCVIVGDPFVSFILEHQPDRSRQVTSQEAIRILEEENQRGHVQHAFFKDAMLQRFYAICNCCSCCCGAFQAHQTGTPMLMSSGYTATIDPDLCQGCERCMAYCQFAAIEMVEGAAVVKYEHCFGCGVCVTTCDQGAAHINLDPAKGEPLEILTLMEEVRQAAR